MISEFTTLLQVAFVLEITREIGCVVFRLHPDEVVGGELRNQPLVVRQGSENLRWRKRYVQEIADAVAVTAVAQHFGKGKQMIIVHPDDVIRLQQIVELVRKVGVYPAIAAEVAA